MNMINLLRNKLDRILNKKEVIVLGIIIIPLLITITVLLSHRVDMKTKIAFVLENIQSSHSFPENDKFEITAVGEKPAMSDIILGNYDAIVEEQNNGNYEVTSVLKSEDDTKIIEDFFNKGGNLNGYESKIFERGMGTTIFGIMVMVILMQSVALTTLYPEDRTLKTLKRIFSAPISDNQYIHSQGIFTFVCIYVPTYIAIFITKEFFGVNIGFSFGVLGIIIGILSAISTAFALFISSVLKQNISLIASGIACITSLLAGCFSSFTTGNKILNLICDSIPLRAYMTMIEGIESGKGLLDFKFQFIYLLIWIIGLWQLGSFITKSRFKKGIY